MALLIHVDGGARGNPGPAGAGVVIRADDGTLVHEAAYFLGRQTNNAAEYLALIRALQRAARCEPQPITLHSDSELLVRQLTGAYQVKSPTLLPLFHEVQLLLLKVTRWSVRHVPREDNLRADELANLAMDRQESVLVFDIEQRAGRPAAEAARAERDADRPDVDAPSAAAAGGASGDAAAAGTAAGAGRAQMVRITVARHPEAGSCPAGGLPADTFTVSTALPAGLCVHAAHALLPTLLAVLATEPREVAAVPTLTVRCGRPGCRAEFQLSPASPTNGQRQKRGQDPSPA